MTFILFTNYITNNPYKHFIIYSIVMLFIYSNSNYKLTIVFKKIIYVENSIDFKCLRALKNCILNNVGPIFERSFDNFNLKYQSLLI